MKKAILSLVLATGFLAPAASCQEGGEVLRNADIIALTEAELPAGTIVSKIESTSTDFDLSVQGLVALSEAGVDEVVLAAMTAALRPGGTSLGGERGSVRTAAATDRREPLPSTDPARRPGDTFREALSWGGQGPEMVVIPPGNFRMGCVSGVDCYDDEKPVHEVTIPAAFAVSKYEVTFAQWEACVSTGGCSHRPEDQVWGRGNRPVIDVSWVDAQEYVRWLSEQTAGEYRLLSESEWEYAARAGASTAYSWGSEVGSGRANCRGCGSQWDATQTAPVGSFGENGFGLHDMHGNVLEWVQDCWNESYSGAPSNGSAWQSGACSLRALRGGSWYADPKSLRSASRRKLGPALGRIDILGLRVARTLTR